MNGAESVFVVGLDGGWSDRRSLFRCTDGALRSSGATAN